MYTNNKKEIIYNNIMSLFMIWFILIIKLIKRGTDFGRFDGINKSREFPVRSIICVYKLQEKKKPHTQTFYV